MIRLTFLPDPGHPQRLVRAVVHCNKCSAPITEAISADAAEAIAAVANMNFELANEPCGKCRAGSGVAC